MTSTVRLKFDGLETQQGNTDQKAWR